MTNTRFPPRAAQAFGLALLSGLLAAVAAAVVGSPLLHGMYPESTMAPALAVAWFAPVAFLVVYLAVFLRLLLRDAPWRDASGTSLARRLFRGTAPLAVAFWLPLAFSVWLWPLTALAGSTVPYRFYVPVLTVIVLVQAGLAGALPWLTWTNVGNAASPASQLPAKIVSLVLGGLLVVYYLFVLGATIGAIKPGA